MPVKKIVTDDVHKAINAVERNGGKSLDGFIEASKIVGYVPALALFVAFMRNLEKTDTSGRPESQFARERNIRSRVNGLIAGRSGCHDSIIIRESELERCHEASRYMEKWALRHYRGLAAEILDDETAQALLIMYRREHFKTEQPKICEKTLRDRVRDEHYLYFDLK